MASMVPLSLWSSNTFWSSTTETFVSLCEVHFLALAAFPTFLLGFHLVECGPGHAKTTSMKEAVARVAEEQRSGVACANQSPPYWPPQGVVTNRPLIGRRRV